MKFLLGLFLNLTLLIATGIPQSGWFWINPLPQGNTLTDIHYIGNNTFISAGYSGTIIKSTNLGLNWYRTNSGTSVFLNSISFINSFTGYAAGGVLLKTVDSGENWIQVSTFSPYGANDISFVDLNTGFAVGMVPYPPPTNFAGFIAKTTNGGLNWLSNTFPIAYRFNSIRFRNDIGIACGSGFDGAIVVRTSNLGVNWNYVTTNTPGDLQSVQFLTDDSVISVGLISNNGLVLKSTTWGEWLVCCK